MFVLSNLTALYFGFSIFLLRSFLCLYSLTALYFGFNIFLQRSFLCLCSLTALYFGFIIALRRSIESECTDHLDGSFTLLPTLLNLLRFWGLFVFFFFFFFFFFGGVVYFFHVIIINIIIIFSFLFLLCVVEINMFLFKSFCINVFILTTNKACISIRKYFGFICRGGGGRERKNMYVCMQQDVAKMQ